MSNKDKQTFNCIKRLKLGSYKYYRSTTNIQKSEIYNTKINVSKMRKNITMVCLPGLLMKLWIVDRIIEKVSQG
jgi:ABC-type phosphate transport system ATPase subunit